MCFLFRLDLNLHEKCRKKIWILNYTTKQGPDILRGETSSQLQHCDKTYYRMLCQRQVCSVGNKHTLYSLVRWNREKNYQTREAGKKVCVSASTHSKTQALQKFMWSRWGQSGQCTLASWRAWVQHQPDIQNTTSVTAVSQKGKAYSSLCVRKNI